MVSDDVSAAKSVCKLVEWLSLCGVPHGSITIITELRRAKYLPKFDAANCFVHLTSIITFQALYHECENLEGINRNILCEIFAKFADKIRNSN